VLTVPEPEPLRVMGWRCWRCHRPFDHGRELVEHLITEHPEDTPC
jgi:hypothetical protein